MNSDDPNPLPDHVSVTSALQPGDWDDFLARCVAAGSRPKPFLTYAVAGLVGAAAVAAGAFRAEAGYPGAWLLAGVILGVAAVAALLRRSQRRLAPRADGAFHAPRDLHLTADGLTIDAADRLTRYDWSAFTGLERTESLLILWLDRNQAELIPWRDLPDSLDRDRFAATLGQWIHGAEHRAGPVGAAEGASRETAAGGSTMVAVALTLLAALTWALLDWLNVGPDAQFHLHGLPGMLWYALPVPLIAWVVWRTSRPRLSFLRALTVVLAAVPLVLVTQLGSSHAAAWAPTDPSSILPWLVASAVLPWLIGAGMILLLLRRWTGRLQIAGPLSAVPVLVGFLWLDASTYVTASLWYPPVDDAAADYEAQWDRSEAVLFSQPGQIDAAVARMAPRQGAASAFFLGFAGYAEQKVFAEEIRFASQVLGTRYGSSARSLLLVNDVRATSDAPLASVSGLQHGIHRMAERMDRDNDLLIVAVSSHGARDPYVAVSNGVLPLRDLRPEHLKQALDEAGVRWRLLVISACYSGAFVEPLADPNTAIVTSAAADRTSFGCSNDRDLTYFGEAFYRDSLPGAATLREAFATSSRLVTERELAAGYQPSNPAAFFGEALEQKLAKMATRARPPAAD